MELNWFNKLKETIMPMYFPADFSAKTICVTHLRNIAHIFLILACKTCYKYNQGHGKKKPLLLVSLRLWWFFFGLKDPFPWCWYSVVSIRINISSEDLRGVIVLKVLFLLHQECRIRSAGKVVIIQGMLNLITSVQRKSC